MPTCCDRTRLQLLSPLRIFGRLVLAFLKAAGYTLTFLVQIIWFLLHKRSDKIGDALGWYGKGLIDCFAGIFLLVLLAP